MGIQPRRTFSAIFSVLAFSFVFAITPAQAAGIVVDTNADNTTSDTFCTLREAIDNANNGDQTHADCNTGSAGADTITFDGNYTITLGSNLPQITSNITLDGTGFTIAMDGAAAFQGLYVQNSGNLTLNRITIQNANIGASGAGIYNNGGVVALTNSTLNNNTTTAAGGGLYNNAGTVTLTDSTVSNNTALVSGGLHTFGGTLTIDNVEVIGNTASGRAGGIYNYSGILTIQNGSVIGRSGAPNTACTGGGIFSEYDATTTIDASTVSYNISLNCPGGGIYLNANATLIIQNGSVINNNAAGDDIGINTGFHHGGGGIYGTAGSIITITDSMLSNNTATCVAANPTCGGGAIKGGTTVNIHNSTFDTNTSNFSGGSIYAVANTLDISNTTFYNNQGDTGGALTLLYPNITTITNTTFDNNSANTGSGGAIFTNGTLTLSNSTFDTNTANGQGGGIANGGTLILTNNTFFANSGSDGGAINNGNTMSAINNTIVDNTATGSGAGIYNVGTVSTFTNNILANPGYTNCVGTIPATTNSLASDTTCGASSIDSVANIGLRPLGDNGGPTETIGLEWDSVALSAADTATCADAAGGKDQRGVTRASDACDIGAFERDADGPTVVSYSLVSSYTTTGPNNFTIQFNVNLDNSGNGTDPDDAENPDNYMLVEEGSQAGFQTTACRASDNDFVNDTLITTDSVNFDHDTYLATIGINGGTNLPVGSYRLFVCGTTSITSPDNSTLNGGDADTTEDFVVIAATATATPTATIIATITPTIPDNTTATPTARPRTETLPDTGFAPNIITELAAQPAELTYTSTDIVLNIPSLGVSQTIVGVPQSADGWNVSWLGNGVGYLAGTAFPTWAGNTALTGHVWNADGSAGIFANLDQLQHGDRFTIEAWGLTYTYEVRDSEQVYATNLSVLDHSDYDIVTLLTCEDFSEYTEAYRYRRAVTAVLVSVK